MKLLMLGDVVGSPGRRILRENLPRIRRELGCTVNIGISSNKLLAKMAGDFEKPDRTHTLFPAEIPAKTGKRRNKKLDNGIPL